jgi:hypothetical protein
MAAFDWKEIPGHIYLLLLGTLYVTVNFVGLFQVAHFLLCVLTVWVVDAIRRRLVDKFYDFLALPVF